MDFKRTHNGRPVLCMDGLKINLLIHPVDIQKILPVRMETCFMG